MAVERYVKPQTASTLHANRPALSRELLALLGAHADLDPNALFICDADGVTPWTLSGGATLEATANRGTKYASLNRLLLDAQNEQGAATLLAGAGGIAQGCYLVRVHCIASAAVAGDLSLVVRNTTDGNDVLSTTLATRTTDGFLEALVTIRAADEGDTLELRLKKATATANSIRVDYATLHPADAIVDSFGKIPRGGRIEYGYTSGDVTSHTIYDAAAGGNAIETAVYTYGADGLSTLAQTRSGRTLTTTYTYTSGDVTKETLAVS